MLSSQSILSDTAMQSVLQGEGFIHPQAGRHRRNINADLLLTALIDAFSILVIFLLMSFSSTGDILFIGKDQELPKAKLIEVLDRNPVIRVETGTLYIEDKQVTIETMIAELIALRTKFNETRPGEEYPGIITVQADRRVKYEVLNQIVLAASAAGYGDIRFAVLAK